MAGYSVAVVLGLVIRTPDHKGVAHVPLETQAQTEQILVVLLFAGKQILTEATPAERTHRTTNAEVFCDGQREGAGEVHLVVATHTGAHANIHLITQTTGHIFDGATHGVSAVERSLWTAKHFDALDVVDIQQRSLGTRHVDVIDVNRHALLETRERILLTHPPDKSSQGGVGCPRRLESQTGYALGELTNILQATHGQFVTRERGDRQWRFLQALVASLGGHHHLFDRELVFLGKCGLCHWQSRYGQSHGKRCLGKRAQHRNHLLGCRVATSLGVERPSYR